MSPRIHIEPGAGSRTVRLILAILLLGGIGGGPLVHLAQEAQATHVLVHADGQGDQPVPLPDHHDCPVCVTLGGILAPVPAMALVADPRDDLPLAGSGAAFHSRTSAERTRARSPPLA
jgi:hypothetical protein